MIRRGLPIFLVLILALSVGGVYAVWTYYDEPIESQDGAMGVNISVFDYTPEEILPGGDVEIPDIGQNHHVLIDLILNESNKGYGLNYSDNVVLHKYVERQGVAYSNQKVSGGNLKFILDPKNNTHGLYYCVEWVSETQYYAYTFSSDELTMHAGTETEIVAYRTVFVKESGEWIATTSHYGKAKTRPLDDLGVSADPNTVPFSIDVSTWHNVQ